MAVGLHRTSLCPNPSVRTPGNVRLDPLFTCNDAADVTQPLRRSAPVSRGWAGGGWAGAAAGSVHRRLLDETVLVSFAWAQSTSSLGGGLATHFR